MNHTHIHMLTTLHTYTHTYILHTSTHTCMHTHTQAKANHVLAAGNAPQIPQLVPSSVRQVFCVYMRLSVHNSRTSLFI